MRYIDAEKIEIRTPYGLNEDGELLIPISAVHQSIARTPTADVVEVVRCKDCKYAERYKCQVDPCYTRLSCKRSDYYSEGVDELDFCCYGERKVD